MEFKEKNHQYFNNFNETIQFTYMMNKLFNSLNRTYLQKEKK